MLMAGAAVFPSDHQLSESEGFLLFAFFHFLWYDDGENLYKRKRVTVTIKPKYRGILFILLSAFCFACMSVCVRLAGDIPTIQKSFFRNAVALLVAAGVLIRNKGSFRPNDARNWPLLLGRSIFGTIGLLANFYAVDHLMLSDASMLNKMSPFFAVIASYFLLKEKIAPVQLLTLVGAFVGAMFIIKPNPGNLVLIPSLIGLLGGLCAGTAYTLVRKLGQKGEPGPLIVFVFSAFSCLVALPFLIFDYCPMTWQQTLILLGAGLFAAGGQFSVTAAYCNAPAREISVYDYSQVIFSAVLGFCLFGDLPDGLSIIGYVLICGMAVLNFLFNNRRAMKKN